MPAEVEFQEVLIRIRYLTFHRLDNRDESSSVFLLCECKGTFWVKKKKIVKHRKEFLGHWVNVNGKAKSEFVSVLKIFAEENADKLLQFMI